MLIGYADWNVMEITVGCRYNTVNILYNTDKRCPRNSFPVRAIYDTPLVSSKSVLGYTLGIDNIAMFIIV